MSFGKLYGGQTNPRCIALIAIAKESGLDLELVETTAESRQTADYRLLNKTGKMPTFVGADGFILTETPAIAIYLASQNEKTSLLGKTKQDYAKILQWASFVNHDIFNQVIAWLPPLRGMGVYNKKAIDTAIEKFKELTKVLDDHLLVNTYLVGERLTLADLFVTGLFSRLFEGALDPEYRVQFVNLTRWFKTVTGQPAWTAHFGEAKFCDTPLENKPPAGAQQPKKEAKKEAKKEQPKKAEKPKEAAKPAAAAADEEDEPKPEPKPKHPLDSLPRATFAIDDWKRKYKNTRDYRSDAMPWFWSNVNFEEYSIWQFDFKYNEELTLTFMSNNQIGGFFNRLEGSRKYLFGVGTVYGVNNDSFIRGAFLVRGQDAVPAFDVAPDWESYDFKKLDPTSEADKETVNDLWVGDKPVEYKGKAYEYADGKVFV